MEQSNRHGQPPSQGTANEIRQFLRTRKRVPVNTGLILINILVFLAVELTGSRTQYACYTGVRLMCRISCSKRNIID